MKPSAHEFFEILAREHARGVYVMLRAAGHVENEADDLLQDSLLIAWKRIEDFDRKRPFGPWLRGIAANLSKARWRKQKNRKETNVEAEALVQLQHRFDQLEQANGGEFEEKIELLRACLKKLSRSDKAIVEKKYEGKLSISEIATALSLNAVVVKKRIQRARKRLKDCVVGKLNKLTDVHSPGRATS